MALASDAGLCFVKAWLRIQADPLRSWRCQFSSTSVASTSPKSRKRTVSQAKCIHAVG